MVKSINKNYVPHTEDVTFQLEEAFELSEWPMYRNLDRYIYHGRTQKKAGEGHHPSLNLW